MKRILSLNLYRKTQKIRFMKAIKTLVFDVNETLLDLTPLKNSIDKAFNKEISALWFSSLLHYSLVETTSGNYHDFSQIAAAVLRMIAKSEERNFSDEEVKTILSPIRELAPYPDVKPGLQALKDKAYDMIAYSNGKPEVLHAQLDNAGISSFFKHIHSVDEIKKYKPHSEAYNFVLKKHDLDPGACMMVAAHDWDVYGAASAGLQTCFVERPGKLSYPLAPTPGLRVDSITELVNLLE